MENSLEKELLEEEKAELFEYGCSMCNYEAYHCHDCDGCCHCCEDYCPDDPPSYNYECEEEEDCDE